MELQPNTSFANRYTLTRLLGRGGFSEVWLAKDSITELSVAIKIYAPSMGMDEDGLKSFAKELANVYDLNHSNLLKPQHVDSWDGKPYLVMSFCPNGSLKSKIGKCSEDEIWKIIQEVGAGLAYLHSKGVIHQDIKPDNILISDDGHYLITDFGISTKARNTLRKSTIDAKSSSSGTLEYMGPERFGKSPHPIQASDIWSLGALVFELMTGEVPFVEHGGLVQKSGAEIPEIEGVYSEGLKDLVLSMLAVEPWDRPTADKLSVIQPGIQLPSKQTQVFRPQESRSTQIIGQKELVDINETKREKQVANMWMKGQVLHTLFTIGYAFLSAVLFLGIWSNRDMFPERMDSFHYYFCVVEIYLIFCAVSCLLLSRKNKSGIFMYYVGSYVLYLVAIVFWCCTANGIIKSDYIGTPHSDIHSIWVCTFVVSIPVLISSLALKFKTNDTPFYKSFGLDVLKSNIFVYSNFVLSLLMLILIICY